jgi:hypothetical protein
MRVLFNFIAEKFFLKPARIPPQTPPAGGKSIPLDKLFRPAEFALTIWILFKVGSDFFKRTPPIGKKCVLEQYAPADFPFKLKIFALQNKVKSFFKNI